MTILKNDDTIKANIFLVKTLEKTVGGYKMITTLHIKNIGIIEDLSKITEFVLETESECAKANPELKCITPDYCYVSYLDGEYKEKDVKVRYAQAVEAFGNETNRVKFMKSDPITAVCIYHKGSYNKFRESYEIILKYIEENDYEIIDNPRECYIDGCWNKENEEDYLAEIQFPVNKK